MTIIEPNKNQSNFLSHFLYLGLLIFLAAVLSIHFYNLNVGLKYKISLQEKLLQQFETLNGDLRNQLHQVLDTRNLAEILQKQNLISDKNPEYLEHKALASS